MKHSFGGPMAKTGDRFEKTSTRLLGVYPKTVYEIYQIGKLSPVINRKLMLTDNALYRRYSKNIGLFASDLPAAAEISSISGFGMADMPFNTRAAAKSETYARLRGKLYKGSAALGVTLGTYKESRSMIVSRYKTLTTSASQLLVDMTKAKSKGKNVAGMHLEYVFGWVPLVEDIIAATTTVIQLAPVRERINVSVNKYGSISRKSNRNGGTHREQEDFVYRCNRSVLMEVSNPNLWLMERAGLLNPAAVAWDLVPWSFVVNMFVNTGQLVNSITDFVGLVFPTSSMTETYKSYGSSSYFKNNSATTPPSVAQSRYISTLKERSKNGVGRPPLTLKLPSASWELAAIAASLFTQKLGAISRLLK